MSKYQFKLIIVPKLENSSVHPSQSLGQHEKQVCNKGMKLPKLVFGLKCVNKSFPSPETATSVAGK